MYFASAAGILIPSFTWLFSSNAATTLGNARALNRYSEAEKLVRSKMKDEPGSVRYEIDLGYIYLLTDKPEKATKTFDEVIEKMKPNRANINEVANAFTSRQQYDYAIKAYLRGREILQYSYTFNQELARTYEMSGNYGAMIEEYLDLLLTDPSQLDMVQSRLQSALSKDIALSKIFLTFWQMAHCRMFSLNMFYWRYLDLKYE